MSGEQAHECWRWPESNWVNPDVNWQEAQFVTVGVDVGSVSSQAVVMADGEMLAYGSLRTGFNSRESARRALDFAVEPLSGLPEERIDYVVGTGYGRVNVPMADRSLTEVACHARGAHFIYGPEVRTVLDVGGQDIKAIRCDEKGKVIDFILNDKCAAGTGRGMEVFADLVNVPIQDIGEWSFRIAEEPPAVSNTCVVYAKSEAVGLLRKGWGVEQVLAAYCSSTADYIHSVVERLGVTPEFAATGGMAKNRGVMERLMNRVGLEFMKTEWDPQLAGAIGAALFGRTLCQKWKKRKKAARA